MDRAKIQQAADRLWQAHETGIPCAPVRDLIGDSDVAAAYAVQEINTRRWLGGEEKVLSGRKIGLTSLSVQHQIGVDQPDFGMLFDDMEVMDGEEIAWSRCAQPKVEAEVGPLADIGCSMLTVYAILAAYIGRQKTGAGQFIDASLYEAGLSFAVWDICDYWGTGNIPERIGTANRMAAPYQAVRASDGHFVLGANNDRLYRRLCETIGRADLIARFDEFPDAPMRDRITLRCEDIFDGMAADAARGTRHDHAFALARHARTPCSRS